MPQLRPAGDLVRGERDTGCPERPDMLVRELKEELESGDARSAQDRQQGVLAAPEAARRDRARHLAEP